MTTADIAILIVALLPYATVAYAKAGARTTFNNADPRNPGGYSGKAERANNAHLNGFEIFPFFAIAVLFAEFRSAPQAYITILASAFILIRLLYIYVYIQGWPNLRSSLFSIGLLLCLALFVLPILTHDVV